MRRGGGSEWNGSNGCLSLCMVQNREAAHNMPVFQQPHSRSWSQTNVGSTSEACLASPLVQSSCVQLPAFASQPNLLHFAISKPWSTPPNRARPALPSALQATSAPDTSVCASSTPALLSGAHTPALASRSTLPCNAAFPRFRTRTFARAPTGPHAPCSSTAVD